MKPQARWPVTGDVLPNGATVLECIYRHASGQTGIVLAKTDGAHPYAVWWINRGQHGIECYHGNYQSKLWHAASVMRQRWTRLMADNESSVD